MSEPDWNNSSQTYWENLATKKSGKSSQDLMIWATTLDYIEDSFDFKEIYKALPSTGEIFEWAVPTGETNTTIIQNGQAFKNIGSDICFAEAISKTQYTSGVHTCHIQIIRAKEYSGHCSNTSIGLKCGDDSEISVHGDGNITVDDDETEDTETDLEFGEGAIVTLSFDCDKKTITWQVNQGKKITKSWPSSFNGGVNVYAKVIRQGDTLAFANSTAPSTSGSVVFTFVSKDNNTEIISSGNAFRNKGSDICWSKGKSSQEFSTGTHTCVINIDKAKEYGGKCSNTYVGIMDSNNKTCYISGDGNIHSGGTIADKNAEFSQGNKVKVTIDCGSKSITWQVDSKPVCTANWPSDFGSSVHFFGQVIRNGDSLSFDNSSVGSTATPSSSASPSSEKFQLADDKNTEIINGGNAFKNIGSDICWSKAKTVNAYSSGTHTCVINIDKAKEYGGKCSNTYVGIMDSNNKTCYISGDGNIHSGGTIADKNAEFSQGNKVKVTIDCGSKSITWQVDSKPVCTANWPSDFGSSVHFFGQVIRNGDSLSFDNSSVGSTATPSPSSGSSLGSLTKFGTSQNSSCIVSPRVAWDSNPSLFCSSMQSSESGHLIWTGRSGSWDCAGIELPSHGRYVIKLQFTEEPNTNRFDPNVMLGIVPNDQHNWNDYGYPGTGGQGLTKTSGSGSYWNNSIAYWVTQWTKDEKTKVAIDMDSKTITFYPPKSANGAPIVESFSFFSSSKAIFLVSLLSGSAVRIR